jgi:hypothetical protein
MLQPAPEMLYQFSVQILAAKVNRTFLWHKKKNLRQWSYRRF